MSSYGIFLFLKYSLINLLFTLCCLAFTQNNELDYYPYPQPDAGYVTDLAKLLPPQEQERIEKWLWQVERRTNIEIIVVTVESLTDYPDAENDSIESFAKGLFNRYGIGNMPENNGILLLVSFRDREARIELGTGYGHARDSDANDIIQGIIVPAFRKGDYIAGVSEGVEQLASEFAGVRIGFPWNIVIFIVTGLIILLVGISLIKSGKRGWGWVLIGLALVFMLAAIYLVVSIMRNIPNSSSGSWSSGGAGGFGGGSSGGGGASGSW